MESTKFVGMDVHKDAITIAVMNSAGKVIMESIIETKAVTILQFIQGLRADVFVTFEEGTWAAWLYDLLKPHVTKVVVCNPRKSALLKDGSKGDKIDARKLAELLRGGYVKPVYHGENGLRMLKELSRSYLTISKDLTRVMNRIKALYRGWAIPCGGTQVYALCHRSVWLSKIPEAGVRRRAEDRKSTRLNSSHSQISYAVFCLKKKTDPPPHVTTVSCLFAAGHGSPVQRRTSTLQDTRDTSRVVGEYARY